MFEKLEKKKRLLYWLISFQALRLRSDETRERICPTGSPDLDRNFNSFKIALLRIRNDPESDISKALIESVDALREILKLMEAYPKCDKRLGRQLQKTEVNALNEFIQACYIGADWAHDTKNGGLEAATFYKFTKAVKGWRLSEKMFSLLSDDLEKMHTI